MYETMRTCINCKESKSPADFYVRNKVKGHLSSTCKECDKARAKKRHLENPDRTKNNDLMRTYGITLEEHTRMFEEQNGVCYLCKKPGDGRWKKLCVDHDHETGKVRKLLCRSCNTALGQVGDSVDLLKSMIEYLS
jgi:hypothetical protein